MTRLTVGIDARFITRQPRRGIGSYSLNLVSELVQVDSTIEYILYISSPDVEAILPVLPNVTVKQLKAPFYPLWENIALPLAAIRDRIDVLHCLGNTAPLFMPKSIPLVLSLMDVMFLQPSEFIPKPTTLYQKCGRIYRRFLVPRIARSADRIITISEYSRYDILKMVPGLDCSRVIVTHLSSDKLFSRGSDASCTRNVASSTEFPYILCLGAEDPRKNTLRLIRAFIRLINEHNIREHLVISGYANWQNSEAYRAVRNAGALSRVTFLEFIDIDDLAHLYSEASVFVYASLYEGFGIPLLEAFSSGCPVIASRVTSIPEVGGDAALYFDPLNEDEIAQTLLRVLRDDAMRVSLKERGYARSAQFSWKETARKTVAVYRKYTEDHI
jgi:glycosyltransferase involved in cell wall biosynthesis